MSLNTRRNLVRSLALLAGLVPALAASAQNTILTGPIVNPTTGHQYLLISHTFSDWSASSIHAAVVRGGYLATINDAAENEWVRANLANFGGVTRKVWLGLSDRTTEGTFVWQSAEAAPYRNWSPGEPSNSSPNDDYALMNSNTGTWDVRNSAFTNFSVVEIASNTILVPQNAATIQRAIEGAADGTRIHVAPGVYNERIDLLGKDITLFATGGPVVTTIDAQNGGTVVACLNQEAAVIDGFTITGGRSSIRAGGIAIEGNTVVRNCVFTANTALTGNSAYDGFGGGAGVYSGSPAFINCTFRDNEASQYGGGMYLGINASHPRVLNCTFARNLAGVAGSTSGIGGGIVPASHAATIANCVFSGNSAVGPAPRGGAVFTGTVVGDGNTIDIINCTMTGNTSASASGIYVGARTNLVNCIVWGNTGPAILSAIPAYLNARACISESTAAPGLTNVNPLFVNARGPDNVFGTADDDLRLQESSPAIDAGNAEFYLGGLFDYAGNTRFTDAPAITRPGLDAIDVGAYEFQPAPACTADLDDGSSTGTPDGGVTIDDLLYFLQRFEAGC